MGQSFTPQLKKLLLSQGCRFERQGKGDHEIWFSPITERRFVVDSEIKSRHTANAVLKQAGIDRRFQVAYPHLSGSRSTRQNRNSPPGKVVIAMQAQNIIEETQVSTHPIVSSAEWVTARRSLLAKEKELTRMRDELARQRRELPWERVDKNYVFAGPDGPVSLAELFDGRSQLVVYHFMFGPEWAAGCPSCSMVADHLGASGVHLAQRDVTLAVVSRAQFPQIAAFQQRMGWPFQWVSSFGNDFNRDYHVSFTPEEMAQGTMQYNYGSKGFPADEAHGVSVFLKAPENADGEIFHTYSAYARGAEELLGVYSFLDLTPKGRDEGALPFPMAWIRHHDRYEDPAPKPAPVEAAAAACCAGEASA